MFKWLCWAGALFSYFVALWVHMFQNDADVATFFMVKAFAEGYAGWLIWQWEKSHAVS